MGTDRENSTNLEDSTAILLEEGAIVEDLMSSIGGKVRHNSPLQASCCIFKVPELIRRQKVESYVPDVVSIGPYHRSPAGGKFVLVENVKRWYLHCLLSRSNVPLKSLIQGVTEFEKRARDCYAEPLDHIDQKDFLEMLILDGCFLIELFRKKSCGGRNGDDDPIFNMACMLDYLYHDLLLLENQLPWFVLEFLYQQTVATTSQTSSPASSLIDLVLNFFRQSVNIFNPNLDQPVEVLHILDLIRTVIVVPSNDSEYQQLKGQQQKEKKTDEPEILLQRIPNATTLLEAGVEFKKRLDKTSNCIMNIEFNKDRGVLSIPRLGIDERTGPLFRNLIAFEQCHHARLHKITSYAVLMDGLIDTSKDIDLLCQKGILANWLSSEDAAKFFNDLYNDTAVVEFFYGELCHDVNTYYNTDWHKWKAKLRHDYFSTPWAVISFIAAFILLVLTLVQTVYGIHQF